MDTPFDSTLENDIKELMKEVPAPIRAFFASGKVEVVAKNLMQKYRLHVDQGAIVEREVILLLLGLKDPTEFTKTLAEEARLDQQTVNGIVQDVNAQIFVPLRGEMRKGPQPQAAPASSASWRTTQGTAQGTARPAVLPQLTTIIPANPNLPPRPVEAYGVVGPRPAQTLASVPRYVPPKKYFNLQNKIPPPINPVQPKPQIISQTIVSPKLLEDHEEPSPSLKATEGAAHLDIINKVQGVSSPTTETPLRQALRTILPENLPGAMPPPLPTPPPKPEPVVPSVPITPYSADPYREPVE